MSDFNLFINGNNNNINNDKEIKEKERTKESSQNNQFIKFHEEASSIDENINLSSLVKSMYEDNSYDDTMGLDDEDIYEYGESDIEDDRTFQSYEEVRSKLSDDQDWLASGSFNIYSDDIQFYYDDETGNVTAKFDVDGQTVEYTIAPDGIISSDNSHKMNRSDSMNLQTPAQNTFPPKATGYGSSDAKYSIGKDNEITIEEEYPDGTVKTAIVDKEGNLVSVNGKPVDELKDMDAETAKQYISKNHEELLADENNNLPDGAYSIDSEGNLILKKASDGKEYKFSANGTLEEVNGMKARGSMNDLPEGILNEKQNETINRLKDKLHGEYKLDADGSLSILLDRTYSVHINAEGEIDYIMQNGDKITDPKAINSFFS